MFEIAPGEIRIETMLIVASLLACSPKFPVWDVSDIGLATAQQLCKPIPDTFVPKPKIQNLGNIRLPYRIHKPEPVLLSLF